MDLGKQTKHTAAMCMQNAIRYTISRTKESMPHPSSDARHALKFLQAGWILAESSKVTRDCAGCGISTGLNI